MADKSILIIDDSQRSLATLVEALERAGYAPISVQNEDDPMGQFGVVRPELVFISLLAEQPLTFCDAIRETADGAIVPIVFIGTGKEAVRSPSDALTKGADYYFSQPLEMPKVLAKVQTYVGQPTLQESQQPLAEEQTEANAPALPSFSWEAKKTTSTNALGAAADALLADLEAQGAAEKRIAEEQRLLAEEKAQLAKQQEQEERLRREKELQEQEERLRREKELQEQQERQRREKEQQEELARELEAEKQRLEEEAQRRAQQKAAEEKARLEARRRQEEEQRQREEERRQREQEAERLRIEREEAKREASRLAAEELKRLEAERLRAQEEARQIEKERKRLADEEQKRRAQAETERKARIEAERQAADEARQNALAEMKRRSEEQERRRIEEDMAQRQQEEKQRRTQPKTPLPTSDPEELLADELPSRHARLAHVQPKQPATQIVAPQTNTGDFSLSHDISQVLCEFAVQQISGRVDFSSEARKKSLFFESGSVVDAYSSQVFDRMEEFLLRQGKLTRPQYNEIRVKGLKSPRQIASYVVQEGYLKTDELFDTVRAHLEDVVLGLFEWEKGSFQFVPELVDPDNRVTLDRPFLSLVVEGIRRKYLMPRLVALVGGPSTLISIKENARRNLDALGLHADEKQVLRLLDGTHTIEDLVFNSGLSALRVYHILAALLLLGVGEVLVRGLEGIMPDGTSQSDQIDRQRIAEKLQQARLNDYFVVLGVPRTASSFEIDVAYERLAHNFTKERFSEVVQRESLLDLQEITRVLQEAHEVLHDERLRQAYSRHLVN